MIMLEALRPSARTVTASSPSERWPSPGRTVQRERAMEPDDQPTCGTGLAANAVLPAKLAEWTAARAEVLQRHTQALDRTDPAAREEVAGYTALVHAHRTIAGALARLAQQMAGYRDLPMGWHDAAVLADPTRQAAAYQRLVALEREVLALLSAKVAAGEEAPPMQVEAIRWLFAYDRWATRRVLTVLDGLDPAVWTQRNAIGDRSLGSVLIHHLGASQRWRIGFQTQGTSTGPAPEREPLPPIDALRDRWEAEWAAVDAWLPAITDDFVGYVHEGIPVWQMLVHVVNHGTQHRAEAAAFLTAAGRSPGELDVINYAEEQAGGAGREA
jgi:uncharacterized damage-inducible protein DinB